MVEQGLHLLTLHVMWKGRGLMTHPDDEGYRETLETQRGILLEKLVEFAVGTQSNTVDGVKRAVSCLIFRSGILLITRCDVQAFKNLIDLHVLFSASQTVSADGVPLPSAAVALTMEDEVQYRCAGYIQAEMERYAEIVGDIEDNEDDNDSDAGSDAAEAKKSKRSKKTDSDEKGKSRSHCLMVYTYLSQDKDDEESRARLEKEYTFLDIVTTFLRAIRAGVIHLRHSAVILAHYGRLGASFNLCCSKVIVEAIREEWLHHDDGDIVVLVITQALQEVSTLVFASSNSDSLWQAFTMVIDKVARDEENAAQLAKQLSTCFLLRGTQLAIVRRLDVRFVVQVHTMVLSWLTKRLSTYNSNNNQGALARTLTCFRALAQMLSAVQTREALAVYVLFLLYCC